MPDLGTLNTHQHSRQPGCQNLVRKSLKKKSGRGIWQFIMRKEISPGQPVFAPSGTGNLS